MGMLRGGSRLVTLTGAGGSGKTCLALHVAADLAGELPDGAVVVPLAPVREPGLVASAMAEALGVREVAGQPIAETISAALRERRCLVVLDNYEHLLAAAPLVGDLLGRCPRLTVLVTSQSPLRIHGEQEFPVPPLSLPGTRRSRVDDLAGIPSIDLFVQRARAVDPAFTLDESNAQAIADICLRLDGLPLAIELAAARVKILTPEALLGRLGSRLRVLIGGARDQPARLQTMRNAIDWSYDLLTTDEQRVLRWLSVFAGGFTLEAAEAVVPSDDTLDLLASLVDKSLLQQTAGPTGRRFVMLETIREYGQERLAAGGEEEEARRWHAAWCLAMAQRTASADLRRAVPAAVREVVAEHDNLRAALSWLREHDPPAGLELAVQLYPFWFSEGMLREAMYWLEATLARADAAPADLRAIGLLTLGKLTSEAADTDQDVAIAILRETLELFRAGGDDRAVARCLANLAMAEERAGREDEATAHYEDALARYAAVDDGTGVVNMLANLGDTAWRMGDLERSESYNHAAREHPAITTSPYDTVMLDLNVAQLALSRGDVARARAQIDVALDASFAMGFRVGIIDAVAVMAAVAEAAGEHELAARWLGAVDAACASVGIAVVPHHGLWRRGLAATRASLDPEAFDDAFQRGTTCDIDAIGAEARGWDMPLESGTRAPGGVSLSRREQEVLRLLVAGRTDRQIAEALYISPRTAQFHVGNIFNKLGVSSRTAAATAAIRLGLTEPPDDETR